MRRMIQSCQSRLVHQIAYLLHHRHEEKKTNATRLRDAQTRKELFATVRPTSSAQRHFAFLSSAIVPTTPSERPQMEGGPFFFIIARRREAEEEPIARARARLLFLLLLFAIQKRKERPTSSEQCRLFCLPRSFRRRLRNDLRCMGRTFYSIIARRREAEEEPIRRARARVFFFSSLPFTRAIYERKQEEKKTKCASSGKLFSRPRSFGTISAGEFCIVIIARRLKEKPKKNRESSSSSKARTFCFYICGALYLSLSRAYFLDEI